MGERQRWGTAATAGLLGAFALAVGGTPAAAQTDTATDEPSGAVPELTAEPGSGTPSRSRAKRSTGASAIARHRIRPGESLWSISRDRLGAEVSDAAVQRYLVRIWDANAKRMRTDDPNLIPVQVTITLPARPRA